MSKSINEKDKRVLELKEQIEKKKEKLSVAKIPPVTNMSLELNGARFNLNVLDKNTLIHLLVNISLYNTEAKVLGYLSDYRISGFTPEEWMQDIEHRITMLSMKEEEKTLKAMETKLNSMLSSDYKFDSELEEIEKHLKG